MLSGLSGLSGLSAVCGGAAAAFSPTQLSGYVNSPYNIALLRSQGKLWQDTAMTVPATADGDPVRRIDCGGTYYDAPSDAARPLLWDEGGGKWSLSFDGVDDYLVCSTGSPVEAWVSARFNAVATGEYQGIVTDNVSVTLLTANISESSWYVDGSPTFWLDGVSGINSVLAAAWHRYGRTGSTSGVTSGVRIAVNHLWTSRIFAGRMVAGITIGSATSSDDRALLDAYLAAITP